MSSKRNECPHGYDVAIRFVVCDRCIALRKLPKRDRRRRGKGCQECGHKDVNHYSGGIGKGCVVYLEDASGFCACDAFVPKRGKKLSAGNPLLTVDVRPEMRKKLPFGGNTPIIKMPLLRAILDDAAKAVEKQAKEQVKGFMRAQKPKRKRKPKPAPVQPQPVLEGRARIAFDEEV